MSAQNTISSLERRLVLGLVFFRNMYRQNQDWLQDFFVAQGYNTVQIQDMQSMAQRIVKQHLQQFELKSETQQDLIYYVTILALDARSKRFMFDAFKSLRHGTKKDGPRELNVQEEQSFNLAHDLVETYFRAHTCD